MFALVPLRIEDLLKLMATISSERRQQIGLIAVALGVGLVALARRFGGWSPGGRIALARGDHSDDKFSHKGLSGRERVCIAPGAT